MKKLFISLLIIALCLSIFAVVAFADDSATVESTSTSTEEAEISSQTDGNDFYDRVIAFVGDGAFWAKFLAILFGILALLIVIRSNLSKIKGVIDSVVTLIKGKATREETEAAITACKDELNKNYVEQKEKLEEQYAELASRNDQLTAVLSLIALQMIRNPNARTQIMGLLADAKKHSGDVAEIVETVETEIAIADAAEEKINTPALDEVVARVTKDEAVSINLA